jgi:hypothetical protein
MELTMQDIEQQIIEDPLSYEDAKEQFVAKTNELGLKHAFTFDEAWEAGQLVRKKAEFREGISKFHNMLENSEISMSQEELHEQNKVTHDFADGCYIRRIFNPAGLLLVTKIHKRTHPFFLMSGKMSVFTEDGVVHLEGPHHGITRAGTKRVIYTHTDCVFVTVHVTDSTDLSEIEEEVIAKDFDDPEISLEGVKNLIKEIQ